MVTGVVALRGVVLQKVGEHIRGGEVVDGDDLRALVAEHLTESQTTNAAKAVDSNLNCHAFSFRRPHGRPLRRAGHVGNTIGYITASAPELHG